MKVIQVQEIKAQEIKVQEIKVKVINVNVVQVKVIKVDRRGNKDKAIKVKIKITPYIISK